MRREVARRLRIRPEIKQAMEEAFAAVLNEFRDATLQKSAVLESVGRQVHGVTGGQMREFAQRLRAAAPRPFTEEMILEWADAHYGHAGEWPCRDSGDVLDAVGETWADVDRALRRNFRSLHGSSSLAQLLAEKRGVRNRADLAPLDEEQILAWADAHKKATGDWPNLESGKVIDTDETWLGIDATLRAGRRGFPGGSSLAKLLAEHRGVRNHLDLPDLTINQILSWLDAHQEATGDWPKMNSGQATGTGETWTGIDDSLRAGRRGLPGGSSLATLLAEHRGVRNIKNLPPLTIKQILSWVDAHKAATGDWPNQFSGQVTGTDETWHTIQHALMAGRRGLPGGSSLANLLAEHRGVRNVQNLPPLTIEQILGWVDEHKKATGDWPKTHSGQAQGLTKRGPESTVGFNKASVNCRADLRSPNCWPSAAASETIRICLR